MQRIALALTSLNTVEDAQKLLQTAIGVEFGTLPPYLYALYSIPEGQNARSAQLIKSVALQEMIHMCLACNMLNALGGSPKIVLQKYPAPLPGDIGPDGAQLTLHLYPFSQAAMEQAMAIEQPEDPPDFPVLMRREALAEETKAVTIGRFYAALDTFLHTLPTTAWKVGRNQVEDQQFFPGQLFAINGYEDAHRAIQIIVSEGEGTSVGTQSNPLDYQDDLAHYYRFGEIFHDRVLTRTDSAIGYAWGPDKLGVDWNGVYPAIADPGLHDFSREPQAAQDAQRACNTAFTAMVNYLQQAISGEEGALGLAAGAMFSLRLAAKRAFTVPLTNPSKVSGPAFLYLS